MIRRSHVARIVSSHTLLTHTWAADVETMETAIGRFPLDERPPANDCRVAFFEVPHDGHLHVNVTHRYATKDVAGWAGPAHTAAGFVHNRVFGETQPAQVVRHIRDMVFAARV
jgi:hypothetical protein